MTGDWSVASIVQSLISAASGLGGVWLGGQLKEQSDTKKEAERVASESNYLAIIVVAHLDRLANTCFDVAFDDGTSEGRPAGKDGVYHAATVDTPSFEPLALAVEWKVLPAELMYSILNLPYRLEQLEHHIGGVAEHDSPPDYNEVFWTRQHGYAELGLAVLELAKRLRQHADLPIEKPKEGDWDREKELREQRDRLVKGREEYYARLHGALPLSGLRT